VCQLSKVEYEIHGIVEANRDGLAKYCLKIVPMANGTEIIDWQTEMTELEQVTFELKSAEEMVNNQAKGNYI
jgi:hypothetical protein